MRYSLLSTLLACSPLIAVYSTQASNSEHQQSKLLFDIQNTCIVRFDDSISKFDVEGRARGLATAADAKAKHIFKHSIKGFAVNIPCNQAKDKFASEQDIVSFEPDSMMVLFPGPPPGRGGGGDKEDPPAAQTTPWGIDRVGGMEDFSSRSTKAWVIDTGIDMDHQDLNVDPQLGFSAFTGKDSSFDDGHGHGTHVAGTIAAINNDIDVVGVAAGATVVPVKVLNRRGSGSTSGVIAGIDYVAANALHGDCANMSLGGSYSKALNDAVIALANVPDKDIYVSLAAGNESQHASNVSPASAEGTNIWTIAATASDDSFATFSNYGMPPVDYAAPGVNILSLRKGGGTTSKNGTSMAAPHACGVLMVTDGSPQSSGTSPYKGENYSIISK
ncbi:S8 family serine peptidase [Vibrio sp. SCSIO 43137]|uniref:S8 family serine peptidase n=1 Tax=Vibrio sp. SCSIO 43137 TaxID=3021011 RepID=UPI00230712D8|nr:S8 family serine peptidase [Vibrio sp. SCSIO 43137]WCE30061.1 S8 family serine peptidase [Vibrio sp. SCSIO 43137]